MDIEKKVKKAMKGNKKEFEYLISMEKEKLYRIAFLHVKNQSDALEIVQEAVYKAFVSIKHLKDSKLFFPWLKKILINCALDFLKRKKKVVFLSEESLERLPEREMELDTRIDLINAIDKLDGKYKSVIILKYYEDLTLKEISHTLDIPVGTVKSTLHRAIRKLKVEFREDCING